MSCEKRSHTIDYFFKKRQKSNKHDSIYSIISDTSNNLVHLEKSNNFIDERIVFDCIENIILNIESNADNDLLYLVSKGPFQSRIDFSVTERYKLLNQTCKFVPSWYSDFPYVEYSIIKDKIYCFTCRLFGFGVGWEQAESAWTTGTNK